MTTAKKKTKKELTEAQLSSLAGDMIRAVRAKYLPDKMYAHDALKYLQLVINQLTEDHDEIAHHHIKDGGDYEDTKL